MLWFSTFYLLNNPETAVLNNIINISQFLLYVEQINAALFNFKHVL